MSSSGGFAPSGIMETAWCAPPGEPAGAALILAPKELMANLCRPSGTCTTYQLRFTPIDSRLRLASIHVYDTGNRTEREVRMRHPRQSGDGRSFTPCVLTSGENDRLARWDRIEARSLVDTLGYPNLDGNTLPAAVRATLQRWERSVAIPYDGVSADGESLTPELDGYWQSGANFIIAYSLHFGGFGPHSTPYLLVLEPGGDIVWNGAAEEYERRGLNGTQRMARQLH